MNGALLGALCYATFDLTSQAVFKVWATHVSLMDITWGALARDTLLLRAVTTGQRTPAITSDQGLSWTIGADIAWVDESIYLPENLGYELTETRQRVRAGAHYKYKQYDVFYGIAYLSEEFEAQPEGQFVGTFQARIDF